MRCTIKLMMVVHAAVSIALIDGGVSNHKYNNTKQSTATKSDATSRQANTQARLIDNNATSMRGRRQLIPVTDPPCNWGFHHMTFFDGWCLLVPEKKIRGDQYNSACLKAVAHAPADGEIRFQNDDILYERRYVVAAYLRELKLKSVLIQILPAAVSILLRHQETLPLKERWICYWYGCNCHLIMANNEKFYRTPCDKRHRHVCGYRYWFFK